MKFYNNNNNNNNNIYIYVYIYMHIYVCIYIYTDVICVWGPTTPCGFNPLWAPLRMRPKRFTEKNVQPTCYDCVKLAKTRSSF